VTVVIGLDLGTTNCKAAAVNPDGEVVASCSNSYRLYSPHPGWAEQDANEVWVEVQKTLSMLIERIKNDEVAAICLSGAMHSVLPIGTNGEPLGRAMTWADQRAAGEVKDLRARVNPEQVYQKTGCPIVSIYNPAKISWWSDPKNHQKQIHMFVTIKDWIVYQLTGIWCSDLSLASSTGLFDIHQLKWEAGILEQLGIDEKMLPELVSPKQQVGSITAESAKTTGLKPGVKVIAGASDGGLANLGSGATRENQAVVTVGTSGAVRRIVSKPLLDNRERTWCYVLYEDRWFAGGAINNGGLALQWVRERFYPDIPGEKGFSQLMSDADKVDPGSAGVFVLPYFTGERSPHWNATARASFTGFGLEHSREHAARAVLEGVAFCLADVWEALTAESMPDVPIKMTGGITRSPVWAQIVCDVLGVPADLSEAADASVFGAAILGYLGLDPDRKPEDIHIPTDQNIHIEPNADRHQEYLRIHREFQELYERMVGKSPTH
jgi:gluconokinase